jgi:hypothetical protein
MANELTAKKNEIVVYRPNETLRLDVNVENETVWLTQAQMVKLFERDQSVIARHIRNAFKEGEVSRESNMHFLHNAISDKPVQCYDLDVIFDNKRLFLFGASLKDLGWKCFAFTELNANAIPELKARV